MDIKIKQELEKELNSALEQIFKAFDNSTKKICEELKKANESKKAKEPLVKITVEVPKSYRDWVNSTIAEKGIYQNDFFTKLIEKAMNKENE